MGRLRRRVCWRRGNRGFSGRRRRRERPLSEGRASKKYKTVRKSYVNAKGMFVTEDVRVTDDEAEDGNDNGNGKVEVAKHKGQYMEKEQNGDAAVDAVMTNKENSTEQQNGQKIVQKKAKAKKVGKSPKPGKKGKSGNIMNFFKTK